MLWIQGKDGIPLQQQRLTFKVGNQEEEEGLPQRAKDSTCGVSGKGLGVTDLIQDLQTWKALLRCDNVILGKLENPLVSCVGLAAFLEDLYLCQLVSRVSSRSSATKPELPSQLYLFLHSSLHRRCTSCFQGFILPYISSSPLYWYGDGC